MRPSEAELVHDWNLKRRRTRLARQPIELLDETLRDGIQGPSVLNPHVRDKIRILELSNALGVQWMDLGLPGASARAVEHVTALAQHIVTQDLSIKPACAARTLIADIEPIARISQQTGQPIEVLAFLGTSFIRQYAEGWDLDMLLRLSSDAIDFAVKENLPITFVTEDTIRSKPSTLQPLFQNAINRGAHRLCLCDTVGHATPDGVRNLIQWTMHLIEGSGEDIGLDWHGHNDRGLGLANALFAIEYGADRIHGTALGVGERVGNVALDQLLVNLKLLDEIDHDLSKLGLWCHTVSKAMRWPIPKDYPVLGQNAFRTATGVHAAAVIKAHNKGDRWLADRVYSGVPAGLFGREQSIEIGHMSGLSNVQFWLKTHHIKSVEGLPEYILDRAKAQFRVLTDEEIRFLVSDFFAEHPR